MANCNKHFIDFNSTIRLTDARRKSLKTSRDELRRKVKKWFQENKPEETIPEFRGQGSMSVDTIINPIRRIIEIDGKEQELLKYDVDDGIYFIGDLDEEDRPSPATYHRWIYDAVQGHTAIDPIDKNTCIRTIFANGRNIDQPIYYEKDGISQLAHKKDGWIISDPQAFTDWFQEKVNENSQLRKLVRYGKAWLDNRDYQNASTPMPSGFVLTILIAENAVFRNGRLDIALKETLLEIQRKLQKSFVCYRPTSPEGENLLADYNHKDYFMKCLAKFIEDATDALKESNLRKATLLWQAHLSDRFPLGEDKEDESSSSSGLGSIIPPTTRPYS